MDSLLVLTGRVVTFDEDQPELDDGAVYIGADDLQRMMTVERIGAAVKATVVREGELRAFTLTPGELPE